MLLPSKSSQFNLVSRIFIPSERSRIVTLHMNMYFQKIAKKSPNQNNCSQFSPKKLQSTRNIYYSMFLWSQQTPAECKTYATVKSKTFYNHLTKTAAYVNGMRRRKQLSIFQKAEKEFSRKLK